MFKIELKDHEKHYLIEEVEEVGFTVFSVEPEFTEVKTFNTAIEAINYCLMCMDR